MSHIDFQKLTQTIQTPPNYKKITTEDYILIQNNQDDRLNAYLVIDDWAPKKPFMITDDGNTLGDCIDSDYVLNPPKVLGPAKWNQILLVLKNQNIDFLESVFEITKNISVQNTNEETQTFIDAINQIRAIRNK